MTVMFLWLSLNCCLACIIKPILLKAANIKYCNEGAEEGGRPRAQPKEGAQKTEILGKYWVQGTNSE